MRFVERLMAGIGAFRKAYMDSGGDNEQTFESIEARSMRYRVYWSFYSNTAYSNVNSWVKSLKVQENLYKYIRNIYNPSYRIGEFYREHLLGGSLDIGDPAHGCLPVETDNPELLGAISTLWQASNMQVLKDVISLRGAIEGDVFLRVVDDPDRQKVMLERVDAGTVVDLTLDEVGNIKGYIIEEERYHPENDNKVVTYTEEVTRDGASVVYRTYLNGSPYGWYGQSEWENPYGFVPMVHIQHNNVGLDFGWSELHSMRPKVQEIDEQASLLNDYLRKYSDPVWLASGKRMGNIDINDDDEDGSDEDQPGRNRLRIISGFTQGTRVEPLVADMRVSDTIEHISKMLEEIERDYPELQTDIWASGATSGRALRVARERVTSKALQRRSNYDDGLIRAQQMAIAIGGFRGYEGYEGFGLDSYDKGDLDMRFGDRAVFEPDPLDKVEVDRAEWELVQIAVKAGADLSGVLMARGWTEEDIRLVTADGQEEIGGNPWDIFPVDGRFCVYEVDENGNRIGEPLGCHDTREGAEAQLQALYANVEE
jgi:hypothetical protein